MPDSYLIDGYNLIHALGMLDPSQGSKALEQSRLRLLQDLEASLGEAGAEVTVVFDAQHAPAQGLRQWTYRGIAVVFAPKGQSADDLIETLIEAHAAPHFLIVISNDNRLKAAARRCGARGWTDADFLDFLERKPAVDKTSMPAQPSREIVSMSSEEKQRWVREFKGIEDDPALKEFFELDRFED